MMHSFDPEIAKELGINSAVIYHHIEYWCLRNQENEVNIYDGCAWCYFSLNELCVRFPYLSKNQIRFAIDKLIKSKMIKVGCFNRVTYDRTSWYALGSDPCVMSHTPMCDTSHTDVLSATHRCVNSHTCMCDESHTDVLSVTHRSVNNHTTIPNNNNNDTNNDLVSKKERKSKAQASAKTFDDILDSVPVIANNNDLKETFIEFIKMRKSIKAPLTNKGLTLSINRAKSLADDDPTKMRLIVEQSIINSWRGLFPIRSDKGNTQQRDQGNEFAKMLREEGFDD